MNTGLPDQEDLLNVDRNLKKFGLLKYFWLQILQHWLVIVISVLSATAISFSLNIISINQLKSEIKNEFNPTIYFDQKGENTSIQTAEPKKENSTVDSLEDFNSASWIFSKANPETTNDGFYCPKNVAFPSWFIWTQRKFLIENELKLRFKLKDNTPKNGRPPTLLLSYGDKTSESPEIFYTVNILDGDLRTIRVYAEKGKYEEFDRKSEYEPNLDNDLLITLKPSAPSSNLAKITLNPELSFKIAGDQVYPYIPEKEFTFGVPLVSISQQGEGKQLGVGVSKGDCFKILSSNVQ